MNAAVHSTSHHGRCIRSTYADCAALTQLSIDEGVLVGDEVFEGRRSRCASHALVLERVLGCVGNAIQWAQEITCVTAGIARCCFVEGIRIEDWNGVQTWTSAIVREDTKKVLGEQLDGGE